MDVSPVKSSAKCGSDFSIERILSSESESSRGQRSEAPSWLCCTRYQPPRLPRTASSACRVRRSGRHARVPFTVAQAAALEAAYARAPYLAPPALRALAAALQLRDDRIKIWFQNRRARERREKSSIITPPREVALPATALFQPQGLLGIAATTGLAWHRPTGSSTDINEAESSACYNDRYLQFDDSTDSPRDLRVSPVTSATTPHQRDEDYPNDDRPYTPLDVENID